MKKIVVHSASPASPSMAIAGVVVFRTHRGQRVRRVQKFLQKPRRSLQEKIDADQGGRGRSQRTNPAHPACELSEVGTGILLLYSLKEDIPAPRSIRRTFNSGPTRSALDTQITFHFKRHRQSGGRCVGRRHAQFVLQRQDSLRTKRRGKFELQEVRVDGIPVPNILIQALFKKYVKPKYPDVDLNEPFDMPWGIEELKVEPGKATVVY